MLSHGQQVLQIISKLVARSFISGQNKHNELLRDVSSHFCTFTDLFVGRIERALVQGGHTRARSPLTAPLHVLVH
jgi:hypothetical protein